MGSELRKRGIMQEDLLGYLLGALEPHEMRRVEQYVQEHPEARAELDRLERKMRPLEETEAAIQPPRDLVARTLSNIPLSPVEDGSTDQPNADSQLAPVTDSVMDSMIDSAMEDSRADRSSSPHAEASLSESVEPPRGRRSRPVNWAVGAVAAAIVFAMLVPNLLQMRESARRSVCQDQLRELGTALTQFVERDAQHRLPEIAREGPEAFAGMYAIRLADSGLMSDPSVRWCPSVTPPSSERVTSPSIPPVPSLRHLNRADVNRLQEIQRTAGGNYAYTLGVVDGSEYQSPRHESRASFAVLADVPVNPISVGGGYEAATAHQGGINVLYEDGSVQFVATAALDAIPDHPLQNHRGDFEAGVNVDDASLAPSWRAPFLNVRQR